MKFAYRKPSSLLNRMGLGVTLLIVSEGFTGAQTLPPYVGIITQLSWGVTYRNEEYQKKPEKAQTFMKILQGDYFQIEGKAMGQPIVEDLRKLKEWVKTHKAEPTKK